MKIYTAVLLLVFTAGAKASSQGLSSYQYHEIFGSLCIRPEFVQSHPQAASKVVCAALCSSNQRCRAFTTVDSPCQLFVFDRCSKSVKDCTSGCSRRGQVFVKQQPGLQPGALCPSGYGDDLCGVKYKLLGDADLWWPSRRRCEAELGLVIMADVMDAAELDHVESLWTTQAGGKTIWLGGHQPAGSPEPRGGWYWVGCNITLDGSLWSFWEPGRSKNENVVGRYWLKTKLADFSESDGSYRVLCECVSPFD